MNKPEIKHESLCMSKAHYSKISNLKFQIGIGTGLEFEIILF